MTIEEKLKDLILTKYRSIREFTQTIDMPYSTFGTILSRGIENSSVTNVIKICKALGISADALADGRIEHLSRDHPNEEIDIDHVINDVKEKVLNTDYSIKLRGAPVDPAGRLLIVDYLDVTADLVTRRLTQAARLEKYAEYFTKHQ